MTPKEDPAGPEEEKDREPFRFAIPGPAILEPHASLRYVGRLFKTLAVGLFVLLVAEIGLGIAQDGFKALPLLLLEVAQLLLFTGLMWGGGDLAYLVIETNHDVRASRVLLLAAEHAASDGDGAEGDEGRAGGYGEPVGISSAARSRRTASHGSAESRSSSSQSLRSGTVRATRSSIRNSRASMPDPWRRRGTWRPPLDERGARGDALERTPPRLVAPRVCGAPHQAVDAAQRLSLGCEALHTERRRPHPLGAPFAGSRRGEHVEGVRS